MRELTQLLTNLATYNTSEDRELVIKAGHFAERCHRGFLRLDTTPYILHPIAVAMILNEWQAPPLMLAAALLHDIHQKRYSHLPSSGALKADLEAAFPDSLLSLIQDITLLGKWGPSLTQKPVEQDQELYTEGRRGFLWTYRILERSPMAVVIKLADRLHNVQSHELLTDEIAYQKSKKWFAHAILNVFAPLADRMGMRDVKEQLEDGAFSIDNPEQYAQIDTYSREVLGDQSINQQIGDIQQLLHEYHIEARVFSHLEHRYAIFRQQLRNADRKATSAEASSIFVIVDSIEDCYRTLGVLHSLWSVIDQVENTLTRPKPNGYRALRMRAYEPSIGAFFVVIHTEEMYLVAKHGIIADWRGARKELLPKIEPLPERPEGCIMTITPKGEVIYLPRGATAIDFAYARSEDVGHRLMQAWVNGNQFSLTAPLEDGSVVDIIVSRSVGKPSPEWLQYVVTPAAREAIGQWTQQEIIAELVVEGTDRVGLLIEIIECISRKSINMIHSHTEVVGGRAKMRIRVQGTNTTIIEEMEGEIKGIPQITHAHWEKFSEAISQADSSAIAQAQRSANPYSYSSPARGDAFKGREEEVQEVIDRLRGNNRSNVLLIWGQQRIGKTSLLRRLADEVLPNEKYLIVYITLQDVEGQPIGHFLHKIALELQRKAQMEENMVPDELQMRQEPVRVFQKFMDKLEQTFGPQNLLIILDEFQGISTLKEEGATKQEVFSYFRSLVQHGMWINFLLCGGGIYEHLLEQSGIRSFLAAADSLKVESLDRKAAVALVTELDRSLHYDDQAIERLLELTDCHPCYLTFLCKELYQSRTQQRITLADVEGAIGKIVAWPRKLEPTINHFWFMGLQNSERAKKQKDLLAAIAYGADSSRWMTVGKLAQRVHRKITSEELPELLANLTDYGSIDKIDSQYRVHLPLLELWLRETQM